MLSLFIGAFLIAGAASCSQRSPGVTTVNFCCPDVASLEQVDGQASCNLPGGEEACNQFDGVSSEVCCVDGFSPVAASGQSDVYYCRAPENTETNCVDSAEETDFCCPDNYLTGWAEGEETESYHCTPDSENVDNCGQFEGASLCCPTGYSFSDAEDGKVKCVV